jgi:hypothetical protein
MPWKESRSRRKLTHIAPGFGPWLVISSMALEAKWRSGAGDFHGQADLKRSMTVEAGESARPL